MFNVLSSQAHVHFITLHRKSIKLNCTLAPQTAFLLSPGNFFTSLHVSRADLPRNAFQGPENDPQPDAIMHVKARHRAAHANTN